jgi:hypothetical protein
MKSKVDKESLFAAVKDKQSHESRSASLGADIDEVKKSK